MRTTLTLLALLAAAPSAQAADVTLDVYLHEYSTGLHLLPEEIRAEEGDTLVLTVMNQGTQEHDVVVCGDEPDIDDACTDVWGRTRVLLANETQTIRVPVKEAGQFEYYCSLFGHKGVGMRGTLLVEGGAKETPVGPLALLALGAAALVFARRSRA